MTTIADCTFRELPRIARDEGNITVLEGLDVVPFDVARVFYIYDVVGGADRGGHAHRRLQQFVVAAMGAFNVIVDDGTERRSVELNRAYRGLYLPAGIWSELVNFSSGAVAIVLASIPYDEADYVRDHDEFLALRRSGALPATA